MIGNTVIWSVGTTAVVIDYVSNLWHKILGHLSKNRLEELLKHGLLGERKG